ncbi:UNVERIFIED_CONTAM: transmembrane protein, putative [Hammondia hammondi]|eukprot:XP_008887828.1 transmembrane protein, putative [Hammondia hammondi]
MAVSSTVTSIFVVLVLLVLAIAGFAYYVNTKLAERDALKKKRPTSRPRKKDREYWSLD